MTSRFTFHTGLFAFFIIMSRAFVKEPDGEQAEDDLPERPQSDLPNYITPAGLVDLKQRWHALQREYAGLDEDNLSSRNRRKLLEQELKYLEQRIQAAIVIDPAKQPADAIRFGATVELLGENDKAWCFTIVGEDEADPGNNRISWASPLARALMGRQVDDMVVWERPAGQLELEVTGFHYES